MTEPTPTPTPARNRRPSPVLLLFLLFPLLGLLAGIATMASTRTPAPAAGTPAPVTLPPAATQPQWGGQPAPDFELRTLAETTVNLSDYRGRVVFLNFWATWCVPCERELPAFEAFMASQPEGGATVLAVNLGETYDQVKAYLDEREISGIPVLLDVNYEVSDLYAIGPIPVTFVIDEAGIIRFSKYGEMKEEDIRNYLAQLVP